MPFVERFLAARVHARQIAEFNDDQSIANNGAGSAPGLFEIPSGYLVGAPLIRQWDYRAQPGVIEPLLERSEEDGEPELARAM